MLVAGNMTVNFMDMDVSSFLKTGSTDDIPTKTVEASGNKVMDKAKQLAQQKAGKFAETAAKGAFATFFPCGSCLLCFGKCCVKCC
jgi:hypothetical protein